MGIGFKSSPLEDEFRKKAIGLLDSAAKEVLVITGEFHVFDIFQDLRWAIKKTISRGVKFRVMTSSPSPTTINKLLVWGAEVCQIPQKDMPKKHYLIVDRRDLMISNPHSPRRIGVREGVVYANSKKAEEKAKLWDNLAKKGKRILEVDWKQDPLFQVLERPMNFGIVTNGGIP